MAPSKCKRTWKILFLAALCFWRGTHIFVGQLTLWHSTVSFFCFVIVKESRYPNEMCLGFFSKGFWRVYSLEKLLLLSESAFSLNGQIAWVWLSIASAVSCLLDLYSIDSGKESPSFLLEPAFLLEMTPLISVTCSDVVSLGRCFSWAIINVKFGSVRRYFWSNSLWMLHAR